MLIISSSIRIWRIAPQQKRQGERKKRPNTDNEGGGDGGIGGPLLWAQQRKTINRDGNGEREWTMTFTGTTGKQRCKFIINLFGQSSNSVPLPAQDNVIILILIRLLIKIMCQKCAVNFVLEYQTKSESFFLDSLQQPNCISWLLSFLLHSQVK